MAGITAVAVTGSLLAGDTLADKTVTGFITKEQVTLGVTGSPTTLLWTLSKPSNSGTACRLSNVSASSPVFTPDVEGNYVVTCTVDSITFYRLTMSIVSIANTSTISALRFLPMTHAQVPAPRSGSTLFFSSELSKLAIKLPDDSVAGIETT